MTLHAWAYPCMQWVHPWHDPNPEMTGDDRTPEMTLTLVLDSCRAHPVLAITVMRDPCSDPHTGPSGWKAPSPDPSATPRSAPYRPVLGGCTTLLQCRIAFRDP